MHRPNCTIDGGSRITMVDTTVTTQTDRLANLMVSPTAFTFGFGMTASPAGYSKTDGSHLRGSGLLRINWMYMDSTFTATYSGVTTEGADSVHVTVTIGCKGVKHVP